MKRHIFGLVGLDCDILYVCLVFFVVILLENLLHLHRGDILAFMEDRGRWSEFATRLSIFSA